MVYDNVLSAVGHTPMIRLNRVPDPEGAEILVKFEGINIGGSIKTRTALNMILEAEKQGLIKKTASNDSKKLLYRYTGSSECKDHLHLQCFKCGKTYHLKMPATNALINDVMQNANFEVDSSSTVLYGVCEKCRNE